MSVAPRFLWSGSEVRIDKYTLDICAHAKQTPFEAKPAPVVHSQSYTKASNDYENYLVQRASTKMKFQILAVRSIALITILWC